MVTRVSSLTEQKLLTESRGLFCQVSTVYTPDKLRAIATPSHATIQPRHKSKSSHLPHHNYKPRWTTEINPLLTSTLTCVFLLGSIIWVCIAKAIHDRDRGRNQCKKDLTPLINSAFNGYMLAIGLACFLTLIRPWFQSKLGPVCVEFTYSSYGCMGYLWAFSHCPKTCPKVALNST